MRISALLLIIALSACGASGDESGSPAGPKAAAAGSERIECALGGSEQFDSQCGVERDGASLTLWHPDGGFRRLQITDDGRGVIAADGAAPATVQVVGDKKIEVAVDGDRYRLPATIGSR